MASVNGPAHSDGTSTPLLSTSDKPEALDEKGQLRSAQHEDAIGQGKDVEKGRQLEKSQREQRRSRPKKTIDNSGPLRRHQSQDPQNIITFDGEDDPLNAQNWPFRKKAYSLLLFGLTTMSSQFSSSVFSGGTKQIAAEFGISNEVAILVTALFVLGYALGPVLWAPLSEVYGRKLSVLPPVFVFICLTAGSATAKDAQTLFITRFFAGVFGSAPVVNVGGAISDIFDAKSRAAAIVFYAIVLVTGPLLGPTIGAAVSNSYLGWRWCGYLSVILGSFVLALNVAFLDEPAAFTLLTRKAARLRLETGNFTLHAKHEEQSFELSVFLKKTGYRPLELIYMEPIVFCIIWFNGFVYGLLYLAFESFDLCFGQSEFGRGYSPVVATLPFLAVMLGTWIGGGVQLWYNKKYYGPLVDRYAAEKQKVPPEYRLIPMCIGSVLLGPSLFWFFWTAADSSIQWICPVLAAGFFGLSFLLVFQSGINYLIDAFQPVAASAVASNTIVRSVLAGSLPMVVLPFFNGLGPGRAGSILGAIGCGLAVIPFAFYKYGERLRGMSRYAVSYS